MPNDHVPATDARLLKRIKPLRECQHEAVTLSALIEGLWALSEEGSREASNGANALIDVIKDKADALASDLDALEMADAKQGRAAA